MEVTIAGKVYPLHFGFKFLKEVNKLRGVSMEGVATGAGGMTMLSAGMMLKDPEALETILKAGTVTEKSKPSTEEVEDFIEELIVEDKYDGFFDEVVAEIKKAPVLLKAMGEETKPVKGSK